MNVHADGWIRSQASPQWSWQSFCSACCLFRSTPPMFHTHISCVYCKSLNKLNNLHSSSIKHVSLCTETILWLQQQDMRQLQRFWKETVHMNVIKVAMCRQPQFWGQKGLYKKNVNTKYLLVLNIGNRWRYFLALQWPATTKNNRR